MKIAVCDDDEGCLDSMKQLLASYPGISSEALILQHGGITEKIANSQIWYIEQCTSAVDTYDIRRNLII